MLLQYKHYVSSLHFPCPFHASDSLFLCYEIIDDDMYEAEEEDVCHDDKRLAQVGSYEIVANNNEEGSEEYAHHCVFWSHSCAEQFVVDMVLVWQEWVASIAYS